MFWFLSQGYNSAKRLAHSTNEGSIKIGSLLFYLYSFFRTFPPVLYWAL